MTLGAWYRYILKNKDETMIHCLWVFKGENPESQDTQDYFSPHKIVSCSREGKCIGCEEESLGQLAHMCCPAGCLHDKDDCDLCPMQFFE